MNSTNNNDQVETMMTKEYVESRINSMGSVPEAGVKRVRNMVQDEFKDNSELGAQGDNWERSTTLNSQNGPEVLIINHQRIRVIQNLEDYVNLRRLSLADNIIDQIQGLEACKLLEEL